MEKEEQEKLLSLLKDSLTIIRRCHELGISRGMIHRMRLFKDAGEFLDSIPLKYMPEADKK